MRGAVDATGTSKTYLGCALGHRTSRLLEELAIAHADGSYPKTLARIARHDLLSLDEFLMVPHAPKGPEDSGLNQTPTP